MQNNIIMVSFKLQASDEDLKQTFRPPVDDTQVLF